MFKYCPNCRSAKIVFDNNTKYYCRDCELEFFQNIAAGVVGIYTFQGKILFQVRAQEPAKGKLDSPGGFMNIGETAEEALSRETKEEIGLDLNDFTYLGTAPNKYPYKGFKYNVCDIIFHKEINEVPTQFDKSEVMYIKMMDLVEIDETEIAFPSIVEAVKLYKRYFNL
jgi:NAD+ diphosphatase